MCLSLLKEFSSKSQPLMVCTNLFGYYTLYVQYGLKQDRAMLCIQGKILQEKWLLHNSGLPQGNIVKNTHFSCLVSTNTSPKIGLRTIFFKEFMRKRQKNPLSGREKKIIWHITYYKEIYLVECKSSSNIFSNKCKFYPCQSNFFLFLQIILFSADLLYV